MSKLKNKVVLSVDDDAEFRHLLKRAIEGAGGDFFESESLRNAQDFLHTKHVPHLIILDMKLANENGLFFLKEVRDHPRMKNIPIIVYSSYADIRLQKMVLKIGGENVSYLVKPLNSAMLLKTIFHLLTISPPLVYDFIYYDRPKLRVVINANIRKLNEVNCVIRSPVKVEVKSRFDIEMQGLKKENVAIDRVVNSAKAFVVEPGVYDTHFTLLGVSEKEAQAIRRLVNRYNYE